MRRLNAELAEILRHFFSAASAVSALNVICSQPLKTGHSELDERRRAHHLFRGVYPAYRRTGVRLKPDSHRGAEYLSGEKR